VAPVRFWGLINQSEAAEGKNTVGAQSWRRKQSRLRNESRSQALNLEGAEGGSLPQGRLGDTR
jgi:hypothetical protein